MLPKKKFFAAHEVGVNQEDLPYINKTTGRLKIGTAGHEKFVAATKFEGRSLLSRFFDWLKGNFVVSVGGEKYVVNRRSWEKRIIKPLLNEPASQYKTVNALCNKILNNDAGTKTLAHDPVRSTLCAKHIAFNNFEKALEIEQGITDPAAKVAALEEIFENVITTDHSQDHSKVFALAEKIADSHDNKTLAYQVIVGFIADQVGKSINPKGSLAAWMKGLDKITDIKDRSVCLNSLEAVLMEQCKIKDGVFPSAEEIDLLIRFAELTKNDQMRQRVFDQFYADSVNYIKGLAGQALTDQERAANQEKIVAFIKVTTEKGCPTLHKACYERREIFEPFKGKETDESYRDSLYKALRTVYDQYFDNKYNEPAGSLLKRGVQTGKDENQILTDGVCNALCEKMYDVLSTTDAKAVDAKLVSPEIEVGQKTRFAQAKHVLQTLFSPLKIARMQQQDTAGTDSLVSPVNETLKESKKAPQMAASNMAKGLSYEEIDSIIGALIIRECQIFKDKSNIVVPISLYFSEGSGHATLLQIDYQNKLARIYDPNLGIMVFKGAPSELAAEAVKKYKELLIRLYKNDVIVRVKRFNLIPMLDVEAIVKKLSKDDQKSIRKIYSINKRMLHSIRISGNESGLDLSHNIIIEEARALRERNDIEFTRLLEEMRFGDEVDNMLRRFFS